MATNGGRAAPDLNGYVGDLSLQDAYEFSLGARRSLKVQAAYSPSLFGQGLIVLHKYGVADISAKPTIAPALPETTSIVFEAFGNNQFHP